MPTKISTQFPKMRTLQAPNRREMSRNTPRIYSLTSLPSKRYLKTSKSSITASKRYLVLTNLQLITPLIESLGDNEFNFSSQGKKFLKNYRNLLAIYTSQLYFFTLLYLESSVQKSHPILARLSETKQRVDKAEILYKRFKNDFVKIVKQIRTSNKLLVLQEAEKNTQKKSQKVLEENGAVQASSSQNSKSKRRKLKSRSAKKAKDQVISLKMSSNSRKSAKTGKAIKQESSDEDDDDDYLTQGLKKTPKSSTNGASSSGGIDMQAYKSYMEQAALYGDDLDEDPFSQQTPSKKSKKGSKVAVNKKDLQAYQRLASQSTSRNKERRTAHKQKVQEKDQQEFDRDYAISKVSAGASRHITHNMERNKGNVVKRKSKISRIALKQKYLKGLRKMRVKISLFFSSNLRDFFGHFFLLLIHTTLTPLPIHSKHINLQNIPK